MGDPDTVATGAVMRPAMLRRYALEAGFQRPGSSPGRGGMLRFYRLTPDPWATTPEQAVPRVAITAGRLRASLDLLASWR